MEPHFQARGALLEYRPGEREEMMPTGVTGVGRAASNAVMLL
jgi:hypothetical protein